MRYLFLAVLAIISCFSILIPCVKAEETIPKPVKYDVVPGMNPQFVIDAKNHIHLLYEGLGADGLQFPDIFSVESLDEGKSWSKPVNVSNTPGVSNQASIVLEKNGALDATWRDTRRDDANPDIFFARSTDSGQTWTKPLDISNTPGDSSHPSMATSLDGLLHVVWCDTSKGVRNRDIFYASSTDQGKTWGKDEFLPAEDVSNTAGASSEPKIAIDNNDEVHVVWCDSTPGKTRPDIFYTFKTNKRWSKPRDLSDNTRISSHPGIACGPDGRVYLVWSDTASELHLSDVWCSVKENGVFGKPINVSNTAGISTQPCIASEETGRVAIIWSDICLDDGKPEVYARVSHDKVATLSHLIDMSNTRGSSKYAQVKISRDKFYVVWEEDDGGVAHIMISSEIF